MKRTPKEAELAFLERLAELGAVLLSEYRTTHHRVVIRCSRGHESTVEPSQVERDGRGVCMRCRPDRILSIKRLYEQLDEFGWTMLDEDPPGTSYAEVECDKGHAQMIRRSTFQGQCGTCKPRKVPGTRRVLYTSY